MSLKDILLTLALAAAIAAMALVVHLESRRSSNELAALRSLGALRRAQDDFRSNDRDANGVLDYWTADVYGLYGLIPIGSKSAIRLIDPDVASADGSTQLSLYGNVEFGRELAHGRLKSGYLLRAFHKIGADSLLNDTDGPRRMYGRVHDGDRYAFLAFPISLQEGRLIFVITDERVWKYNLPPVYSATFRGATGLSIDSTSTTAGPLLAPELTLTASPGGTLPVAPASIGCGTCCN